MVIHLFAGLAISMCFTPNWSPRHCEESRKANSAVVQSIPRELEESVYMCVGGGPEQTASLWGLGREDAASC